MIKYLITDNYSGFRSKEFTKFTKVHGITHPISAPYKSRARAYVELYNGILQRALKNLTIFERENWSDLIPLVTSFTQ
jgi:transposase InsO family protein